MATPTEYPTSTDIEAAAHAIYECRWFPDKWIDCHPGTRLLCLKEAEAGLRAIRPPQAEPATVANTAIDGSRTEPASTWRCFHCNEVFSTAEGAADHFGNAEGERPACVAMLTETEKAIVEDRREWRRRAQRAEITVEELGLRITQVETDIETRGKDARAIEDVIRIQDQSDAANSKASSGEAGVDAARILGEALVQLLNVTETDFGRPAAADRDDEPVGSFSDGKMTLTFGHLRRAREALDKAAASTNRRGSESDRKRP